VARCFVDYQSDSFWHANKVQPATAVMYHHSSLSQLFTRQSTPTASMPQLLQLVPKEHPVPCPTITHNHSPLPLAPYSLPVPVFPLQLLPQMLPLP